KPNIVFILTDDQDLHLNSLDHMQVLQEQLVNQGTYFSKHYAHVTQCCPSRASLWAGRHAHNTNITDVTNSKPGGGWKHVQANGLATKGIPVWMQAAGYNTYYAGKLYNGMDDTNYCDPVCPAGWTKSDFLTEPRTYTYYNSAFQHNEGNNHYKPEIVDGYATDHIANYTLGYIDDAVDAGKPFFTVAATVAPHVSIGVNYTTNLTWCGKSVENCHKTKFPFAVPKKEYEGLFKNVSIPRNPNFNPHNRTGVASVWALDQLNQTNVDFMDEFHRQRLRALKSVDDLIETIIQKLEARGLLNNTYIFYSVDNGYHIGQHRLQPGKLQCFEEDINIPFIARAGPNVGRAQSTNLVSGHIDLAPTFLTLAESELEPSWELDGQAISFPLETQTDITKNKQARGDHLHAEFWGPFTQEGKFNNAGTNSTNVQIYKALRIQGDGYNLMYSVWCQNKAHELYDMSWDQYQLTNLHPDAPTEAGQTNAYHRGMNTLLGRPIEQLIHRLDAVVLVQKSCKTEQCRQPWKQLHPNGTVSNLIDALDEKYDAFYNHSYQV
ncbi:alkaline phosphatase-like protein, partial [Rhizodiscina lignyota]